MMQAHQCFGNVIVVGVVKGSIPVPVEVSYSYDV